MIHAEAGSASKTPVHGHLFAIELRGEIGRIAVGQFAVDLRRQTSVQPRIQSQ